MAGRQSTPGLGLRWLRGVEQQAARRANADWTVPPERALVPFGVIVENYTPVAVSWYLLVPIGPKVNTWPLSPDGEFPPR
eukprot:8023382-Pyramimonas_sp.AAC.1